MLWKKRPLVLQVISKRFRQKLYRRQIKVRTVVAPAVGGPSSLEKFKIGDCVNKQRLKITLSAKPNGKIDEISYMVIGEA